MRRRVPFATLSTDILKERYPNEAIIHDYKR